MAHGSRSPPFDPCPLGPKNGVPSRRNGVESRAPLLQGQCLLCDHSRMHCIDALPQQPITIFVWVGHQ
jgi:hypothetical protein